MASPATCGCSRVMVHLTDPRCNRPRAGTPMDLDALTADVLARCDVLAGCSEEPGRLTRTFPPPPAGDVHNHLRGWMEAAGLEVRVDPAGNVVGRRAGGE